MTNVAEYAGDVARHFHFGLTSSDVLDTAGALQLRDALDLILDEAKGLTLLLAEMALEHGDTIMVGRTHGVHAEPTTLGHKLAVWAFEMERNLDRLSHAREVAAVGKISGAVGTYANVDPKVEAITCEELGISSSPASTQVVQRDRHAEVLATLAILGSTIEKIALEIRGAQRTEVRELAEPFGRGQKGSSAMPHKRNPILSERLCGMARLLRGTRPSASRTTPSGRNGTSPTPRPSASCCLTQQSSPSTCSAPRCASCAAYRSTRTGCSRTSTWAAAWCTRAASCSRSSRRA